MRLIPRDKLIIKDRQRKTINKAPLNELKESIAGKGLLNPPTVYPLDDGTFLLIAGERRTSAIDLLAKEERFFSCDGVVITPGEVPVLYSDLDTLLLRREAELDENIIREELSWQERAQALADIHAMRKDVNPKQTFIATATELVAKGAVGGTIASPKHASVAIRESVTIAEHLSDPTIMNARNAREAHALILKREEERVNSILAKRRIAAMPEKPDIEVRHGDLEILLPSLPANEFDLTSTGNIARLSNKMVTTR